MKRSCLQLALFGAAGVLLAACGGGGGGTPVAADLVLQNGKVITADKDFSIVQAVAIKDGKVLAVGSKDAMSYYIGDTTKVEDLGGKTVIPGLMDTHSHMDGAGTEAVVAQTIQAKTVADAQAIIKAFADKWPAGQWVQCSSWHPPSQLAEQRYLTRQELDAASPNNPVFCGTVGHFAMANTKALELAGITDSTPDPLGGKIYRDASGSATGVLEETAMALVSSKIPEPSFDQLVQQNIAAQKVYNRSGITSAVVAGLSETGIEVYKTVAKQGLSTVRASVMWRAPGTTPAAFEQSLKNAKFKDNSGDEWVKTAGIKISIDGGMTLKTAYLRDAYADDPHNHGTLSVDPEDYKARVALANKYGWRIGTHAVGDAAVDLVLDAYENADKQSSIKGKRFVVIHGSLINPDQVVRAKSLDVRVDAQNVFMWDKAATVERYMGKTLANRAVPTKLLIDTLGLNYTAAGTDNQVNILNPFVGLYIMVTRKDPNGTVYGASQAITREQALRMYTSSGPYYSFDENNRGSLEPGKFADMVVLSDDFLTVPDEKIKDIVPLRTIVGGKTVYQKAN